jgi:2-oxoglutarate ferredoxin oxidoreductase subunit alpha
MTVEQMDAAVVRFAGDFGDGIHLIGSQFSSACCFLGNDVCTLPEPPAEIRAPVGSLAGMIRYQVHFSARKVHTPGDVLDVLAVMNPAGLKANLADLREGGTLLVNSDRFTAADAEPAGYRGNPLEEEDLSKVHVVPVAMQQHNREAVAKYMLAAHEIDRCCSFYMLGLTCRLFERALEPIVRWIHDKYQSNVGMMEATTRSLKAGFHHAEKAGLFPRILAVGKHLRPAGKYRRLPGKEGLTLGLVAAAERAERPLVFASFPANPAAELLERFSELKGRGVRCLQSEDEASALTMALGAAFGGAIAVTATSGPGLCQKAEALGLAVMTELPCIVIDVQRAGPSSGMPNKSEQGDLYLALAGRNGDSPVVVLAPSTPGDCFTMAQEAVRLAVRAMTPVVVLADTHLLRTSEVWAIPAADHLPSLAAAPEADARAQPYERDAHGSRPWIVAGTPGREHRLSGLEKAGPAGDVNYDWDKHVAMVGLRRRKIQELAAVIPPLETHGPEFGDLLVLGWGSTEGAIRTAVENAQTRGASVAWAQLRYLNPLPANTGEVLRRYRRILVPELNSGQLSWVLRARFLIDIEGVQHVMGRPFLVRDIEAALARYL